jgi:hypothetical protein
VACRKRQKSDIAGALDRFRQLALMVRTGPGNPARGNFAPLGNKVTQGTDIFIINRYLLVGAEAANFATAKAPTRTASSTSGAISTKCHDYFSFFIVLD